MIAMFVLRCPDCGFPVSGPQPRLLGLAHRVMRVHVMIRHRSSDVNVAMRHLTHETYA